MPTYHHITKATCLNCGKTTTDVSSLELMNDLDPTCECGVHDVIWTLEDGTRSITQDLSEDRDGTTWFNVTPEYTAEDADQFKGRVRAPFRPPREGWTYPTATLGQFREVTRVLPDDTYVTAYDPDKGWYLNLDVTQEAVDAMRPEDGQPSLILDVTGETDTRQW